MPVTGVLKSDPEIPVLTLEEIEAIRAEGNRNNIIPQQGGQMMAMTSTSDITMLFGNRGGGKTFIMLYRPSEDIISNGHFTGTVLRHKKNDSNETGGMVETASLIYDQVGIYSSSQALMEWNFHMGGSLKFNYHSDNYDDFKERYHGKELNFIGIDEANQMTFKKFNYLRTCNRNSHGLQNMMYLAFNPDVNSWVYPFVHWWLSEDDDEDRGILKGGMNPDKNGKERYCYIYGDTPSKIYWGDTREEVYAKAKHIIDKSWRPEYGDKLSQITSVRVINSSLHENKALLKSTPDYASRLGGDNINSDLLGIFRVIESGDALLQHSDMLEFFENTPQTTGTRYASADIALTGGDKCVCVAWDGFHIIGIDVFGVSGKKTVSRISSFLERYRIPEHNFVYDGNGLGKWLDGADGYFPKAVAFNAKEPPSEGKDKSSYDTIKSECAFKAVDKFKIDRGFSIDPQVLDFKFVKTNDLTMTVREMILEEYQIMQRDHSDIDKGYKIISKKEMIRVIGHSPDLFEGAFIYRMAFELDRKRKKTKIKFGVGW